MLVKLTPTLDINQSNVLKDILLIFFDHIKAVKLFDDISCRCIMTSFIGLFPYMSL